MEIVKENFEISILPFVIAIQGHKIADNEFYACYCSIGLQDIRKNGSTRVTAANKTESERQRKYVGAKKLWK